MFDMSWGEILVIGGVALVAIGPKDLPKALRTLGQVVGKVRRMAGEFQAQFNEAIREADLEELRKNASDINDAVEPFKSQFDPLKNASEQLQKALGAPEPAALPTIENVKAPPVSTAVEAVPEKKTGKAASRSDSDPKKDKGGKAAKGAETAKVSKAQVAVKGKQPVRKTKTQTSEKRMAAVKVEATAPAVKMARRKAGSAGKSGEKE